MPCLLTSKKEQKITASAQIRVIKFLFFKATQKTPGADFWNSIFGGCLVIDCLFTFFIQYYFDLILFHMLKRQGISKMALELAYLCKFGSYGHFKYNPFF